MKHISKSVMIAVAILLLSNISVRAEVTNVSPLAPIATGAPATPMVPGTPGPSTGFGDFSKFPVLRGLLAISDEQFNKLGELQRRHSYITDMKKQERYYLEQQIGDLLITKPLDQHKIKELQSKLDTLNTYILDAEVNYSMDRAAVFTDAQLKAIRLDLDKKSVDVGFPGLNPLSPSYCF